MSLMLLLHIGVVDVKLAKETHCTRWGLRSSSPLRVVAIQTIDIFNEAVIYSIMIFFQDICFWLGLNKISHILASLGPPGSNCVD